MKAIRVKQADELTQQLNNYANANLILLDSYVEGVAGGTGERFDWALAADAVSTHSQKIVLAGGLDPSNIATAVTAVRPYAVDVSSAVEASAGIKDKEKMREFIDGVNSVRG
ncbi:MAG: hypothetical protein COC19_07440 [SAR86 cluster bacterium]|uniref:N-(5'-phosphoribosyl)anthranilate isomerase n=1 Tax=SAR86 cluster bacterium TaxID=2030880 RepID=A0A2A4MH52_9GAMM|nr:MAG: hypothetical protein COC19_07440 [SAR86 cluster bacterium]